MLEVKSKTVHSIWDGILSMQSEYQTAVNLRRGNFQRKAASGFEKLLEQLEASCAGHIALSVNEQLLQPIGLKWPTT